MSTLLYGVEVDVLHCKNIDSLLQYDKITEEYFTYNIQYFVTTNKLRIVNTFLKDNKPVKMVFENRLELEKMNKTNVIVKKEIECIIRKLMNNELITWCNKIFISKKAKVIDNKTYIYPKEIYGINY